MEDMNDLAEVGILNSETISDAVFEHPNVTDFLHSDINMSLHATYVSEPEQDMSFNYDIDGVVVELKSATALLAQLHYLLLPKLQAHMLKDCYCFLKKHVDLTKYSPDGLKALKNSMGYTIGHVDGGFHLTFICLPLFHKHPDTRLYRKDIYTIYVCEMFNKMVYEFQKLLKCADKKDKCRATLQKQISSNTSTFHVLRGDLPYILSLLDKAIESISDCHLLKPAIFLTMFGQKDENVFDLTDFVDPFGVASLSVHVACKITAKDPDIHCLFSRYGLKELVGTRGSLYSILGMHEATNYQTDLDHHAVTIHEMLWDVLGTEGHLTFLQLYVDSPHVHIQMPFRHPVSGAIVTCRLSHPQYQKALLSRAHCYLSHMEDLRDKLVLQLGLRIEQVRRFEGSIPSEIVPKKYFCKKALVKLLRENALVIPFNDSGVTHGLFSTLDSVLGYFITELRSLFEKNEGVARYDASWKSFQIELALEEMFFGHPLSVADYQLSVSLGTNTVNPNSLTHTRGFIGLAPHSAASAGEVPPPLQHWTRNELQTQRLERIFPLCQMLEAAPAVTGAGLLKILLCDIFRRNTDIPYADLKAEKPPGRLTGSLDLEVFCEDLSTKNSFPAPNTFGRARELLVQADRDVKKCLFEGFLAEKLRFFPHVKFRNVRAAHKLFWNCRDYVVLQTEGHNVQLSRVATATLQVCSEVERRSLSYSRNLEKYRDHGMVWMEKVLDRLPQAMTGKIHLDVITFVSCVAMIMNGDYVDYLHLRRLLEEMGPHVSQATLQKWRILSQFNLPRVFMFMIWKLHEDIPFRVQVPPKIRPVVKPPEQVPEQQPFEDVQAVEDQDDLQPMIRSNAMTQPANSKQRWMGPEIELINMDRKVKMKDAYNMYVKQCHEKQIPVRTFESFRIKRRRVLNRE